MQHKVLSFGCSTYFEETAMLSIFTLSLSPAQHLKVSRAFTGVPLKGVREVRLHPLKFDSGCSAPLLRMTESSYFMKNQLLRV